MLKRAIALPILVLATLPAWANEERGPTFGLGAAYTNYDLNPGGAFGLRGSDHSIGWEAFGGYRFSRYIAVEASYLDGGHVDLSLLGADVRLSGKAYGASAVGSLPIGDSGFAVFGRAGYMRGDLKVRATGPGGSATGKDNDSKPIFGAGLRVMLDGAHLRLEYDRIDWDAFDSERISLNVAWLF
jgi:OOP family OmpA-OmpF porin